MLEDLSSVKDGDNEESSSSTMCSSLPSSYTLETLLHIDCLDDESFVVEKLEKCYNFCRSNQAQHMFCTQVPFLDSTKKPVCYGYCYQVYQFLFGFVYECQTELYTYITETMLSQCTACMMGYHKARQQLLQAMALVYDTSSLCILDMEYFKWEISRVISSIQQYSSSCILSVTKAKEEMFMLSKKEEKCFLDNQCNLMKKEPMEIVPIICNGLLEVISQQERFLTQKNNCLSEINQIHDFLHHLNDWKHLIPLMIPLIVKAPCTILTLLVKGLLSSFSNVSLVCSSFLHDLCQHFVKEMSHHLTPLYMFDSFSKGFQLWKQCVIKEAFQLVSPFIDSILLTKYLMSIESLINVAKEMYSLLKTLQPSFKKAVCILTPLRSIVVDMIKKCQMHSNFFVSTIPFHILLNFIQFLLPFPANDYDTCTLCSCLLFLKELIPINSLCLTSIYIVEDILFSFITLQDTFLKPMVNKEEFHTWRVCFSSILHLLPPLKKFSETLFVQYDFTLSSLQFRLILRIFTVDADSFTPCHLPIKQVSEQLNDTLQIKTPFIVDYENDLESFFNCLYQCETFILHTNKDYGINDVWYSKPLTLKTIFFSFLQSVFKWVIIDFIYEITFLNAATQVTEKVYENFLHFPRSKKYFTFFMEWIRQQVRMESGNFSFLIHIFLRYIPYLYILKTLSPHFKQKQQMFYQSQWETCYALLTLAIQVTHEIFQKLQCQMSLNEKSTCFNSSLTHFNEMTLKENENNHITHSLCIKINEWIEEFVYSLASFLCGKLTSSCILYLQKLLSILFPTHTLPLHSSKILIYISNKKYSLFTHFAQALMDQVSPYSLLKSLQKAATSLFSTIQIYHVALHAFSFHTNVQLNHLLLSKHSQYIQWCVLLCFSLPALESHYQQVLKKKPLNVKLFEHVETILHYGWKTVEFITQSLPLEVIDSLLIKKKQGNKTSNSFYISDIIFLFLNMWMSSSLRMMECLLVCKENVIKDINIENLKHIENFRQHTQWTNLLLPWCVALQEFHIPLLAKKMSQLTCYPSLNPIRLWNQWRLTETSISIESLCLSIAKGMTFVHRHFPNQPVQKGSFLIRLIGRGDQPYNISQLLIQICDEITQAQKAKNITFVEDSYIKTIPTRPYNPFHLMPLTVSSNDSKPTLTSNTFLKNMFKPMSCVTLKNLSSKPYSFKSKKTGRIPESLLRKLKEEKINTNRKKGDTVISYSINQFPKKWNGSSSLETILPPTRTSCTLGCTMLVTSPCISLIKKNNTKIPITSLQSSPSLRQRLLPSEKAQAVEKASFYVQKVLNTILEWDVFSLISIQILKSTHKTERLPIFFDSVEEFQRIFEPLVLEECRCSLLQESIERRLEGFPLIVTRHTRLGNTAIIVTAESDYQINNDLSCQPIFDLTKENKTLQENKNNHLPFQPWNLVLLIPNINVMETTSLEGRTLEQVKIPPKQGYALCIVEKDEDCENRYGEISLHSIRLRLLSRSCEATITHIRRIPSAKLTINSKWIGYTLGSLTTSIREVQSLFMSHLSPLFPFILHPQNFLNKTNAALSIECEKTNDNDLNFSHCTFWDKGPTLQTVKTLCKLNDSQVFALYHAFTIHHGVALLQGPPGTGKTHTIWALLALLYFYQTSEATNLKKKILVCAPSNAAIDEVASRVLTQGLPSFHNTHQVIHPLCLRVGHPQRITRPEVLCISLTENIKENKIQQEENKKQDYSNHREILYNELTTVSNTLQNLPSVHEAKSFQNAFPEITTTEINYNDLKQTKNHLFTQKKMLHTQINRLKQTFQKDIKNTKRKCQETCLRQTDILFSTLSGSANECLSNLPIDCIIIDEAAQAVELSTLIPLRLQPLRIVLIGDPQQLPATVLSHAAKKLAYERSLFQRLQECGVQSKMLSIQYRMHPSIARFPSSYFYNNNLINASIVQNRSSLPIHHWKGVFEPFLFFHINSQENRNSSSQSLSNYDEALFIVSLLSLLNKHFNLNASCQEINIKDSQTTSNHKLTWKDISIVTPYKQQVYQIRQLLSTRSQHIPTNQPDVCTIDAFQGREKSIIIFSCVRGLNSNIQVSTDLLTQDVKKKNFQQDNKSDMSIQANLGFVADIRRMNVAITRARDCLWVVGNADTLQTNHAWKAFIEYAKNNTCSFINIRDYCEKNHLFNDNPKRNLSSHTQPIASILSNFFAHVEKSYLQKEKKSVSYHKKIHSSNTTQIKPHSSFHLKQTSCILTDLSSVSSSDHSDTTNLSIHTLKKKCQPHAFLKSSLHNPSFKKNNAQSSLTSISSLQISSPQQIPLHTMPSFTLPLQKTSFQKIPFNVFPNKKNIHIKNHSLRETLLVAKKTVAYQPNISIKKITCISPTHVTQNDATSIKKRKQSISDIPFPFNSETTLDPIMFQKTLQMQHEITTKNQPTPILPAHGRSQILHSPVLSNPLLYSQIKHFKKI